MTIPEYFAVFPDGDRQELRGPLRMDQLIDINGQPLPLPLPTNRMIAYRVAGMRKQEGKGVEVSLYFLELLPADELLAYIR